MERGKKPHKKYGEIITDRVDTDYRACRMSDYRHMWAWFHLMNGRCEDGLHALNEAIANSKKMTELKSVTDLMSNKLFFLTICKQVRDNGNANVEENKKPEAVTTSIAESEQAKKKQSLFKKLANVWKKSEEKEAVIDYEKPADTYEEEMLRYVNSLDGLLNRICEEQLKKGQPRDAIQTEFFFYKDRYVKYLEFLIALYGKGAEAGQKALEEMEGSFRCRLCNHSSCMRLTIAKALLAEYQGKKEEAHNLYSELAEQQPYNLYAQAKLTYEEK